MVLDAGLSSGAWLVQLAPGADPVNELYRTAAAHQLQLDTLDLPDWYRVSGGTDGADPLSVLQALTGVQHVQQDELVLPGAMANDPAFLNGSLWGLSGTFGVQAPGAWDTTTGSAAVTVAVIDTGIDCDHIDLYKNIWLNQAEIPAQWLGPDLRTSVSRSSLVDVDSDGRITFWDLNDPANAGKVRDNNGDGRISASDILAPSAQGGWANGVSDDGDRFVDDLVGWNFFGGNNRPYDDAGHGTHVAGTIGATGNNGLGVAGINWKVQLMPLRFMGVWPSGPNAGQVLGFTSDAASAVAYAARNGARVSNNSYGSSAPSQVIRDAVTAVPDHLFVTSAGNSGADQASAPSYPAAYHLPNMLVVAATDGSGNLAGFSNFSRTLVDVGAPGVGILSTVPGGGYGTKSGTSMAAPHVAGVAALVLSLQPYLGLGTLRAQVLNTGRPLASLASRTATGDLVSAAAAVTINNLHWSGGGMNAVPAAADTQTPFAVDRTYAVGLGAVPRSFTIGYYASLDTVFGNADDLFLGQEMLTANADRSVGWHAGTSPALRVGRPGMQYLLAELDAGSDVPETSEADNVVLSTQAINVSGVIDVVLDNGKAAYSETGLWGDTSGAVYGGTLRYASPASAIGPSTATWQVSGLPTGSYAVQATWSAFSNRASNAPYRVYDGSTLVATFYADQRVSPSGPLVDGIAFQALGTVTTGGGSLRVVLGNDANGIVIADAVRLVGASTAPVNLSWTGGGLSAVPSALDTQSPFTVGRTYAVSGGAVPSAFSIAYYASADQALSADDLFLASEAVGSAAGWSVGTHAGTSPALRVGRPGPQYVLAVLDATGAVGEGDEADNVAASAQPITIAGTSSQSTAIVLDNGTPAYSETGVWGDTSGAVYGGTLRFTSPASAIGPSTATWQATGLAAGEYAIQATWSAFSNRASNAPYRVYDGNTLIATFYANQRVSPSGPLVDGIAFQALGGVRITSGTLRVVLGNDANGIVIADAVRLVAVPSPESPTGLVLDNGTAAYSETGVWGDTSGAVYGGTLRYTSPASAIGPSTATWQATGLAAGEYAIQATWSAFSNRASNAPYRVYDGNTLIATFYANQRLAPGGTLVGGVAFQTLGRERISSGTLRVVLGNDANGVVIADAIRLISLA